MDVAEIEELAERQLTRIPPWIWDGETLPIPVEHIADSHFGLHVREVEDLRSAPGVPDMVPEQDLSGLLLPALGEIWVSAREARDWPPRRRFTIAHEVGHWCMHRTDGAVWCRSQVVNPRERDGDRAEKASPPEEREANEFAAALLMPADLLRRRYAQLRRSDSGHRFELLCEIFGASGAAMSRRLARVV